MDVVMIETGGTRGALDFRAWRPRSQRLLHMSDHPVSSHPSTAHFQVTSSSVAMLFRIPVGSTTVEFNMWNPLYALAPFVLVLLSIPLALFATITTSIAVTVLFLRASVVYVQLATALVGAWISPAPPKKSKFFTKDSPTSSPKRTSPKHQRHMRSVDGNSTSSHDTTLSSTNGSRVPDRTGSFVTLLGSSEMPRDYEGMGGWRNGDNEDEEALWMSMYSRLELPAEPVKRRHHRSLTAGADPSQRRSYSAEVSRPSQVQGRARTPVRFVVDEGEEYFPQQYASNMRPLSSVSEPSKRYSRKKSGSGSSSSSTLSGMAPTVKEAGP